MARTLADRSDGELAALSIGGTSAAFAMLMQRHRDAVYRLVRGHIGDADEALDVTQETFVAAFRNLKCYDPARPMRAWLARIAINKSRDWRRRKRVRAFFGLIGTDDDAASLSGLADDRPGVEDNAADAEELAKLTALIAALPQTLREVLLMRTVEDLSQAETANTLGISQKAVETRLYRARVKLSDALGRPSARGVR